MYKLMIKTHRGTGWKYLCITKREDHESYLGSGVYWRKHLDKHGSDISTSVVYQSEDYSDFVEKCFMYSEELNVAKSREWANAVPETGYNNNDGKPNVVLFWQYADEETKKNIIARRNKSIRDNHFSKGDDADKIYDIISNKLSERWDSLSDEEQKKQMESFWAGRDNFFNNKSEKYDQWKSNISKTMKDMFENMDPEQLSERNRKARLNISNESAEIRKKKIQDVYKSGKHDALFKRYSEERRGSSNPAAKKVSIDGVLYNSIKDAIDKLNLARHIINTRLRSDKWPKWYRI